MFVDGDTASDAHRTRWRAGALLAEGITAGARRSKLPFVEDREPAIAQLKLLEKRLEGRV